MLKLIEEKIDSMFFMFMLVGFLCTLLGILVIMYDFLLRTLVGLLLFLLAFVALHMAYKLRGIKGAIGEKFGFLKVNKKTTKKSSKKK